MQIQLQAKGQGTCVSCATINALRHFNRDDNLERVVASLALPGKPGSYIIKAAKFLRREHGMDVRVSRPTHPIMDPSAAILEAVDRWEPFLRQGFVGLLHRVDDKGKGHAVVLYDITAEDGAIWLHCYDSNKNNAGGLWHYRVEEYIFRRPGKPKQKRDDQDNNEDEQQETAEETPVIRPTGRVAYFVRPQVTG